MMRVKCLSGCKEGTKILFYYGILGSDNGIAEDSSFLCIDTVFLGGWFVTFQRIVDIYQKNLIISSCFPCGILLRHTISCGVFMTSGGGNSSEFAVFHYSAHLNFWLLCRSFFWWHEK